MSRHNLELATGRRLTCGYDRRFRTYFAQLWDMDFDPDFDMGAPLKAAGYHPAEQAMPPIAGSYGPYPIASMDGLRLQEKLDEIDWGDE